MEKKEECKPLSNLYLKGAKKMEKSWQMEGFMGKNKIS